MKSGCWCGAGTCAAMKRQTILLTKTVGRHRRYHIVDPCLIGADCFEFRSQVGLAHAAGPDDLQILLVAVEVGADLKPDPVGIKKIEGMDRRGNHEERPRVYRHVIRLQSRQYLPIPCRSTGE